MTKKETEKLKEFCNNLKVKIKDLEILKIALTHRSYINEHKRGNLTHNERLEFLGDAVLELLISIYLYDKYPKRTEGDLTSFRAAIVRTQSLYEESKRLKFGDFIFMSKGEEQTGGRERPYILANTFEAILGAIYIDQGTPIVKKFLERELFYKMPDIVEKRLDIDNKSKLQEIAQEILREAPIYEILDSIGPDHAKTFTSKVLIKEKDFGHGKGLSKQEAEQNAAKDALENWKSLIAKHFGID